MSETLIKTEFAPIGGGGNPLRAWVLACFDIVKPFVFCVLSCFNKLLCYPELVSETCSAINIKSILASYKTPTRHPELDSGSIYVEKMEENI